MTFHADTLFCIRFKDEQNFPYFSPEARVWSRGLGAKLTYTPDESNQGGGVYAPFKHTPNEICNSMLSKKLTWGA